MYKNSEVLDYTINFSIELELSAVDEEEVIEKFKVMLAKKLKGDHDITENISIQPISYPDTFHESYHDEWGDNFDSRW